MGLYALTHRIRAYIPNAEITFLTRSDLAEGFALLKDVAVVIDSEWKRGVDFDLEKTLLKTGLSKSDFDLILERPDPTHWLQWQIGNLTPKLHWRADWDLLCSPKVAAGGTYIGVHVQTETSYHYEKNWPIAFWKDFLKKAYAERGITTILFGFGKTPPFEEEGIVDLRGETSLLEMLSTIKNRCRYLLVPDSGVLSMTYYLDTAFPIDVVSLWADPKQGILKQNVASPNPLLSHKALIAEHKDLRTVSVERAMNTLFTEGARYGCEL